MGLLKLHYSYSDKEVAEDLVNKVDKNLWVTQQMKWIVFKKKDSFATS